MSARKIIFGTVCIGLVISTSPETSDARPLDEEIRELVQTHPDIKAAQKGLESSREEINRTMADYFPVLNVTGQQGYERVDSPVTRARGDGDDYGRGLTIGTATLTQNLFSGFLTESQVRAAKLNREIADLSLEGTRQNTIFDGISAYINVLQQRRLIELARANERTIQRQLNLEDERVRRGSGVAVDVLQAKSRLQIAKERRVIFEGALEDAITTYTQVFDRAPLLSEMTDPVPPVEIIPSDLEKAVTIALDENPAITNASTSIEVAREGINQSQSEYYPSIDLVGQMNYEKNESSTIGTERDWSVVVSADWDLFTGFSTEASVAQAAFEYGASKDRKDSVSRRVVEQTRIAWQSLLTARERLDLLENAVNIASEVFDSRQKLREAGRETVINVLDAENEVNNAQINYTVASYAERTAIFQLLLAMGRLTPDNIGY